MNSGNGNPQQHGGGYQGGYQQQHGGYQGSYQGGYYDNSGYYYNQQQGMHPQYSGYQSNQYYPQQYSQHAHPGHQHSGYQPHAHQQHHSPPTQGYSQPPHPQHMQGGAPPAQGVGSPAASPAARPPAKQRTRALDIVHPATGVVVVPGSGSNGNSENASPDEGSTNSSPTIPSPSQTGAAAASASSAPPATSNNAAAQQGGEQQKGAAASQQQASTTTVQSAPPTSPPTRGRGSGNANTNNSSNNNSNASNNGSSKGGINAATSSANTNNATKTDNGAPPSPAKQGPRGGSSQQQQAAQSGAGNAKRDDGAKGASKKEKEEEAAQEKDTKEEAKAESKSEAAAEPAQTATPASSVPATPTKAPQEDASSSAHADSESNAASSTAAPSSPSAVHNGIAGSPPASPTSPMSAGGKKRYDVSFLLKFQQAPTECPAEIKKFTEIFIDANQPAQSPSPSSGRGDRRGMARQQQRSPPKGLGDFRTSTPKAGGGNNMPQSPTSPGGSRSFFGSAKQRGPNSPKSGHPSGPPAVLPNRAEAAFKVTKPDDEKKATQKTINGLLNKLSPEKYGTLRQQLLDMNLDLGDEDVMEILINAVYERAIAQPLFVELYAQLCHDILREYISKKKQEGGDGEPDGKLFRRKLLEKCQHEFENPLQLGDEAKDWTAEERADRERRLRRRQLGLSRFVGELFKCQILTEKIMHAVIKRLLNGNPPVPDDQYVPSPEEVEVLCKLLSTCGAKLDRKVALDFMNYYFSRLATLSKTYPDSRLRFLLLDVVDLRSNKWSTRLPR